LTALGARPGREPPSKHSVPRIAWWRGTGRGRRCECRTEDGRIIYMALADCRAAEVAVEREDKVKAWCVEVPRFQEPPEEDWCVVARCERGVGLRVLVGGRIPSRTPR
jgi:hypothetical protein